MTVSQEGERVKWFLIMSNLKLGSEVIKSPRFKRKLSKLNSIYSKWLPQIRDNCRFNSKLFLCTRFKTVILTSETWQLRNYKHTKTLQNHNSDRNYWPDCLVAKPYMISNFPLVLESDKAYRNTPLASQPRPTFASYCDRQKLHGSDEIAKLSQACQTRLLPDTHFHKHNMQ